MRDVVIWSPLILGVALTSLTIIIHAFAVGAIVRFVRHERRIGRAGQGFLFSVLTVATAVMFALAAHLIEIALWASAFLDVHEFSTMSAAFYHSAVNYTTLGYGDVAISPAWRLLAPIEAADGMLMFGVSTALIFTVIQRLVQTRFPDLRG
jgi:Ion channel